MATYDVREFGAVSDGSTNNAPAIQKTIDACHAGGGGCVIVPAAGTYLCGSVALKSNVELHVERGATLLASPNPADYTLTITSANRRPFIIADGAENIAVSGYGTIDGHGRAFIKETLPHIHVMNQRRPMTFLFLGCRRVTFRDITIRDGASWTVRLSGCQDVVVHGIRIYNDLKLPNSDAIDLDRCRNVRISDCHIESGDDCICLKALEETQGHGPCENITVRGCTLVSTSAALIIGCEAKEVMRDVVIDSCVIKASHRGLAIHLSEESNVENVLFSNMIVETRLFHHKWWGRAEPIYVTAIPWTAQHGIGRVLNVRFVNILARGENGVYIQGHSKDVIQDILLENVRVELTKTSKWPGGTCDIRPWAENAGGAGPALDLPAQNTAGFFLKNARGVTIRNCEVKWGPNPPEYYRHALESHDVEDLVIENFKGHSAHGERYAAIIRE